MIPARVLGQDNGSPARERARHASRIIVDAAGHRLVDPVVVSVESDSAESALGGFLEGLIEAGVTPRVGPLDGMSGTLVRIRVVASDVSSGEAGFDVRIERLPEHTIVYSRLITLTEEVDGNESGGVLESLLIPVAAIGAAALIILLLFTVRS